jgi:hypothetical protein
VTRHSREDVISDSLELLHHGETDRDVICKRLDISRHAFEQAMYRATRDGDDRPAVILARTRKPQPTRKGARAEW